MAQKEQAQQRKRSWTCWFFPVAPMRWPRPQRSYLAFGKPIDVPDCRGKSVSKKIQKEVQASTAEAVDSLVRDMLLLRVQSKGQEGVLRRLLTQ